MFLPPPGGQKYLFCGLSLETSLTARAALCRLRKDRDTVKWLGRLWLPAAMLGVAALLVYWGGEAVLHPAVGVPPWLGYVLIGAGLVKGAIWTTYTIWRVRFP